MLTNLENRVEELFQEMELLPPDKVDEAEKVGGHVYIVVKCRVCKM